MRLTYRVISPQGLCAHGYYALTQVGHLAPFEDVARAVLRPGGAHGQRAQMIAIGLGCELKYAERLVYARSVHTADPTPIGVNCYVCERQACGSRAHAPIHRKLQFDERSRGQSIFKFDD